MKQKIKLLFLIIVGCSQLPAQPLPELIQQIADNNLSLKVQEKEYYATLEGAAQINPRPDPELGVGIFPLPVETRLGGQALRVSAMQRFPWFGTIDSQKEVALAKAAVVQGQLSVRELELKYQVEQAYLRLYKTQKSSVIIGRNLVFLEALERLALAKVESGTAIAADVLRVQLQIETLRQELAILETQERPPTIQINQILNRSLDQTIEVMDSLTFATLPIDKIGLLEQIAADHPLLKMYDLQQEVATARIDANGIADKPTFGVGVDYIMVNKRDDAMPARNGRDIVQLKAVVRLPLYKGKYESKEKEELLKIEALDFQKADVLAQFQAAIETAYARYDAAVLQMDLYQKQIALTQATIRILETDYSANGKNFDELLRLQKELIEYDLKILHAIVESHLAKSEIDRYLSIR